MSAIKEFLDEPEVNKEGGDIDIMDRVRLKVDIVSQEVFIQLWRQLSETIWVNNHDRGKWNTDRNAGEAHKLSTASRDASLSGLDVVYDDDAEAQARAMAKVIYRIMDVAHMHSLPVAQSLLDYSIERQMEPLEEEDATITE